MGGRAGGGASGGMGKGSRGGVAAADRDRVVGILRDNRDSVISQIKWDYRFELKSGEKTLKGVMEEAVEKAVKEPQWTSNPKRMKTDLRNMVKHMSAKYHKEKEEAYNLKTYGTKKPKLADVKAHSEFVTGTSAYADWHEHKFGVKPRNPY